MKKLFVPFMILLTSKAMAYDVPMFDDTYFNQYKESVTAMDEQSEMEVAKLSKLVAYQQRSYEEKINYLEIELSKTKNRLIEKSLNEEKIQVAMKDKYEDEISFLKKELASKTRTSLEYQRQIEKMNPPEDLKKVIILNNELAADLRKAESQMAVLELENKQFKGGTYANKAESKKSNRMPASVQEN